MQIEARENYQKRSYRNRFYLGSSQGPMEISIPLVSGKNMNQAIKEVQIDYHHEWPVKVLKLIESNYGKSPFFIYYFEELEAILNLRTKFLYDLNRISLDFIFRNIQLEYKFSESLNYNKLVTNDCLDLRGKFKLSERLDFHLPYYEQVFIRQQKFINGLSMLDLLFHKGPEANAYLKQIPLDFIF